MVGLSAVLGWSLLPALVVAWAVAYLALLWWWQRAGAGRAGAFAGAVALNACAVLLLWGVGSYDIASDEDLAARLPVYLGVTGYRIAMPPAAGRFATAAALGPEPAAWPPGPEAPELRAPHYLVLPGIPRDSQGGHALNAPTLLAASCATPAATAPATATSCELSLRVTGQRRDYLPAINAGGRWSWAGTQALPSGAQLTIRSTIGDPGRFGARRIALSIDGQTVRFNGCALEAPAPGEGDVILPVADLYFLAAPSPEGAAAGARACQRQLLSAEDRRQGPWLRPAADGSTQIPAHSFVAVRPGPEVELVPLEDRAFTVEVAGGGERSDERVVRFAPGQEVEIALLRRRFREQPLPRGCGDGDDLLACRQLLGFLDPLAWKVKVEATRDRATLAIDIDRDSPRWRPLAWTELTPDRVADEDGRPTRFSFEQGRWRAGEPRPLGDREELLELPFRLLGGLSYRAELMVKLDGVDGASLVIRDSARRSRNLPSRSRTELGPDDARAVLEFDRARSPRDLARAALRPFLVLALALVAILLLPGRDERVARVVLLGTGATAVLTYTQLVRVHLGYALVVHHPWDPAALLQLVSSSAGLALALAAALAAALWWPRRWPRLARRLALRPTTVLRASAAVLALFAAFRWNRSLHGRELIYDLRLVVFLPALSALYWYVGQRSSSVVDAAQAWPAWLGRRWSQAARARAWRWTCVAGLWAVSAAAWFADLGGALLLLVPTLLAFLFYAPPAQEGRWRQAGVILRGAFGLVVAVALFAPSLPVRGALAWRGVVEIPALPAGDRDVCADDEPDDPLTCRLPQATRMKALEALEGAGMIAAGRLASRRHPMRLLDWLEDGDDGSACYATERFVTHDALEVAFFRAQVRQYRAESEGRRQYLRDGLLPFGEAVRRALVADYLGSVSFVPQMPRGALACVALLLVALVAAAALVGAAPWRTPRGAAGLGALVMLACAAVLTVAANLDLLPNFAQNIPLVAVRSTSAWLLDALALALGLFFVLLPPPDQPAPGPRAAAPERDRA